jgi:hypothetical protein
MLGGWAINRQLVGLVEPPNFMWRWNPTHRKERDEGGHPHPAVAIDCDERF